MLYQHVPLNRYKSRIKIRLQLINNSWHKLTVMCLYVRWSWASITENKPRLCCFLHVLLTRSVDLTLPDTTSVSRILDTRVFGLLCEHTRIFLPVDPDLLVHWIQCNSHPRSACGRGSAWSEFKKIIIFLLTRLCVVSLQCIFKFLSVAIWVWIIFQKCISETWSHVTPVTLLRASYDAPIIIVCDNL